MGSARSRPAPDRREDGRCQRHGGHKQQRQQRKKLDGAASSSQRPIQLQVGSRATNRVDQEQNVDDVQDTSCTNTSSCGSNADAGLEDLVAAAAAEYKE